MMTLTIWVPGPIPDPIAYAAGFKRLLPAGQHVVPNNPDFRRLLAKGSVEPMCKLSSQLCGRPQFKLPKDKVQSEPATGRKDN